MDINKRIVEKYCKKALKKLSNSLLKKSLKRLKK
jgi:hypothetical protein